MPGTSGVVGQLSKAAGLIDLATRDAMSHHKAPAIAWALLVRAILNIVLIVSSLR